MTKTPIIAALVIFSLNASGQNYEQEFKKAAEKKDTSSQLKILSAWEAASPKDPELFIAYFNYYVRNSMAQVIGLENEPNDKNSIVLTDTGTGNPVAYINASVKYHSQTLQKGFDYINRGIALHPARLDMRFGKIYMLGEAENYPGFAKEIVAAIDYGNTINNAWLWKEGKPLDDAKQFFLGTLQDYITTIYNTEDDKLLPLMRQISEAVIKYNPTHVESLANIALTHLIEGGFAKALPFLLKAEEVAPKDIVVLNNIAEAYKRSGDKENAKVYYRKIIKHGSKEEAQDAEQKLKGL